MITRSAFRFREICLISALLPAIAALSGRAAEPVNLSQPFPTATTPNEGLSWPRGQALPIFATPVRGLDVIGVRDLSKDEQITFSSLQGHVNRKQPRIYLLDHRADEGAETWPQTLNLEFGTRYQSSNRFDLIAKYAGELAGVVVYDPAKSPHYRNLAGTAAAVNRALPVTREILDEMERRGIHLKVVEDLTKLTFTTPLEIYQHLHRTYWPKCGKRLIVSAKPHDEKGGGDYHHTRDIAAATGSAVVWLDTLDPEQRKMLGMFFADMKAGEAIALGWYTTERSGVPTATEYGIGTMPADFFVSASVFSGGDHRINIPVVPKMPALNAKAYIAVIISDGDNIQYTQHAMRKNWDRTARVRGKVPLTWTIAPGLVDIAPGILNYYYTTATPLDGFATGPSGMGYLMPFNTLTEPGAPIGDKLTDRSRMDGYTRLTETYLQRSGLRVVTIWDDASPMQRKSYESNCRQLYGATVQNFKDVPSVAGRVENRRIRFDRLEIPYTGSFEHIYGSVTRSLRRWDGNSPLFLSYQVDVWGQMKPEKILELRDRLDREFPGKVEFVRADHYFNLSNEANGLPFNLCMAPGTTVSSADPAADAALATDGTPQILWSSTAKENRWLGIEFDKSYRISRCVIRHAGASGLDAKLNSRSYHLQASEDGKSWRTVFQRTGNSANVDDVEFPEIPAKFVRLTILDAGPDSTARIADVEVYGSR